MTRQTKPGDTHGWHWGDYQNALIFIVDHPSIDHGGMLRSVPRPNWDKHNANIFQILTQKQIDTYFHKGDIFFFHNDTTLRRIYSLQKERTRIILDTLTMASFSDLKDLFIVFDSADGAPEILVLLHIDFLDPNAADPAETDALLAANADLLAPPIWVGARSIACLRLAFVVHVVVWTCWHGGVAVWLIGLIWVKARITAPPLAINIWIALFSVPLLVNASALVG
ncbi:MAG: hypothetical protein QNJ09_11790 [Paracoccaceae bacterium]|nr:hypothetical protein [Paracoccaceae bacterium]